MAVHKVAVTPPEELHELIERARTIEHRSRSEVIQEALRTHFGEKVYVPSEDERRHLIEGLDALQDTAMQMRDWADVREEL